MRPDYTGVFFVFRVPRTSYHNTAAAAPAILAGIMKLTELSNRELVRALRATERVAGGDSFAAKALRREYVRRRQDARKQRAGRQGGAP